MKWEHSTYGSSERCSLGPGLELCVWYDTILPRGLPDTDERVTHPFRASFNGVRLKRRFTDFEEGKKAIVAFAKGALSKALKELE
jgi:hypothetical protein